MERNDWQLVVVIVVTMVLTAVVVGLFVGGDDVDAKQLLNKMCWQYGNGSYSMSVRAHDGWFEVKCAKTFEEVILWENTTQ
jgi:hypothetical protein